MTDKNRKHKDKSIEILQSKEQCKKRIKKNKQNHKEIWDTIKYQSTRKKKCVKKQQKIFKEIMRKLFPNVMKIFNLYIQEANFLNLPL